jgi:DNA polymerase I-like protein with 3'-5' exonuclease and polymerase domains
MPIVVPLLHPAAMLRGADRGEIRYKDSCVDWLRKGWRFRGERPRWDVSCIGERSLFPTVEDVWRFACKVRGQQLACDVETTGEQTMDCRLICVGLGTADSYQCVPVLKQGGQRYWSPGDEQRVFEILRLLLGDPATPKLFWNGAFDTIVLWCHGVHVYPFSDDGMLAHHVLDGELPHGLAYSGARYTDAPYWKSAADVKGKEGWLDLDDRVLRGYNGWDVLATARIQPVLLGQLRQLGLEDLYRKEVQLSQVMSRATIRGLRVDLERRDSEEKGPDGLPKGLGPRCRLERDQALGVLRGIAASEAFNPGSHLQLQDLLFSKLKFPVLRETEKGKPATDKQAMILLALHADQPAQVEVLKALIKWRRNDKILGTYVDGLPILRDQRLHVSWKQLPVTGRLSSSPNAQNWGKSVKKIFCAGAGNNLVGIDLSQAELRTMAYFAQDAELLRMYEQGINVHTVNASLVFGVRTPGMNTSAATEAYLEEMCPKLIERSYQSLPVLSNARWERARHFAKTGCFATNYGIVADSLFEKLRAERDATTDELLFPTLGLGEVEAFLEQWKTTLHPAIPAWWEKIVGEVCGQGHYKDPISGRVQWYRGGMERNELLSRPIQGLVASHMLRVIKIDRQLEDLMGSAGGIVAQVHDAITLECPSRYSEEAGRIMETELARPFDLPWANGCVLPPDAPTVGRYLDEV